MPAYEEVKSRVPADIPYKIKSASAILRSERREYHLYLVLFDSYRVGNLSILTTWRGHSQLQTGRQLFFKLRNFAKCLYVLTQLQKGTEYITTSSMKLYVYDIEAFIFVCVYTEQHELNISTKYLNNFGAMFMFHAQGRINWICSFVWRTHTFCNFNLSNALTLVYNYITSMDALKHRMKLAELFVYPPDDMADFQKHKQNTYLNM